MPVLDRYKGESIIIGDNIKVTILGRKGEEIRIGIHAPKSIPIVRTELRQINRNKNDSASSHEKL